MREEDALRTVDCLRGRLQAERAAADNVDLLSNKLKELEKHLKIEIKSRKKAEKKLKLLKKKLESLNITNITEECCEQSQSSSSNNSDETSCMSSISSSSYYNQIHQQEQEGYQKIPETEGASKCSSSITGKIESEIVIVMNEGHNSDENCYGSKHIVAEEKRHGNASLENQDDHHVDDSMALVLVSSIVELKPLVGPRELEDRNVVEVLDTLKQIRENLQSSLDTRSI